jgi:gas vesicle protein
MKVSRLLLLAAVGVAAGLLLTQTEKGNELRNNLSDRASGWGKKLRNLRDQSEDYIGDMMDDATQIAKKAKRKAADGQMA